MMKRLIALALVLTMAISMVPVTAGAENEVTAVSNDVTLEGNSSFGNLLTNTVNESQQEGSGEAYDARICDLVIEGATATVEYTTPVEANLVVAIYDQNSGKMLGSGTVAVSPEETIAEVAIEIPVMPYYFSAGAYLLDAATNDPVSEEFKTDRYTKVMQDILAATVEDFNPELVLNLDDDDTTNFAVFNENTLLAAEGEESNRVSGGDGVYTITNADERFLSMKPGDTFTYTYSDGTMLIVNAASVRVEGTTVTVKDNPDADLTSVFDFVKIEADSYDKDYTYDDSTLSEGLTVISDEEFTAAQEESQVSTFGLDVDRSASIKNNFNISFKLNGNDSPVKIDGKFAFGLTFNLKVYLSLSYQYVAFSCDYSISGSIALNGKAAPCKLPLGKYDIALCAGVYAHVDPSFVVEASESLSYKIEWKGSVGRAYDSRLGTWADISSPPSVKSKVEFSGKLFIGVKAEMGIAVLSEKTLDLSVTATTGFEVSAADKWQGLSTPSSSEVHMCEKCFEGEIDSAESLELEIKIFKDVVKDKFTLVEFKAKITDIYCSLDYFDWGFTKCPHKAYQTTFTVFSASLMPADKIPIVLFQNGEEREEVFLLDENKKPYTGSVPETNEDGKTIIYLSDGEYSYMITHNGVKYEQDFTVQGSSESLGVILDTLPPGVGIVDAGRCGKQISWLLDTNGTLTISGRGNMFTYSDWTGIPWYDNKDNITRVIINPGVTSITKSAFRECTNLASVDISDSVTAIDAFAFSQCPGLTSVTIPDSVTSIGEQAFRGCTSLTSVVIPDSVTELSGGTFCECSNLTRITIPDSVTSIGGYAFDRCTSLTSIDIPDSVTSIGSYTFARCSGLTSVTIPDSVTTIAEHAFWECTSLTSVTIPGSITNFGRAVFFDCTSLTSATFSQGITSISDDSFRRCTSLTSVLIPDSVTSIGEYAFWECTSLTSVTIPDSVKSIGKRAFENCTSLTSVDIPNGVTSIGYGAFMGCTSLTSVIIPDSVTSLDDCAFESCTGLIKVSVSSGMTVIKPLTFAYCTNLASVTIPNGVTMLGIGIFLGCSSLTAISIPDSVTTIGDGAFSQCTNLTSVTIPDSVTKIVGSAFSGCTSLTSIVIPDSVTSMGTQVLSGCKNLSSVTLPNNITSLPGYTFSCCASLTSVTIPDSVTTIGSSAFSNCTNLTSISIPHNVTTIEETAFYECTNLRSITIPSSVTFIGKSAFYRCDKLQDVEYKGSTEQWAQISIETDNNDLVNATIHCTDGTLNPKDQPQESTVDAPPPETEAFTEEPAEAPTEPTTESMTEPATEPVTEPTTEPATEPPVEETMAAEDVAHIQWYSAPAGAEMTVEPVLQKLSAFSGTESVKNGVRSVKFTGLEPGEEYVLIVSLIPGSLVPENLLYIDQNNANPDGTLSFTYIPRQDVSARVQLYGVPAGRTVTLDREYLTMEVGSADQKITAAVTPEEWAGDLTWSAENPENTEVISVNEFGDVTPMAPGTAYAVATVTHGRYEFSARCRVDVTQKRANQEVTGVQLGTTSLTTELLRTDYAAFDVILLLAQNRNPEVTPDTIAPDGGMGDNGVAIESAAFADEKAAAVFDLAVKDDRTLLVVPKASAINNPKPVAGSYTSKVRVTVDGKAFITDTALKLTVKKSMPKLKVSALTFNPFYTGQSQAIQITGATVTDIESKALPEWLTLENGVLTLTEKAPAKASGKVSVTVKTAEWGDNISTNLTIPVKTAYAAPKLKLSATSVTVAAKNSQGISLKLLCGTKTDTLETLNVEDIQVDGFQVKDFDRTDGSFTLIPSGENFAGPHPGTVSFSDTRQTVPLSLKVTAKAPSIAAKPASVTLNSTAGDSARIPITASPADYRIPEVTLFLTDSRGNKLEQQDWLNVWYENGVVTVKTVMDKTQPGATYYLHVSTADTRDAVITVKTLAASKSTITASAKVSGGIDLSFPASAAVVKPAFKNYASGGFTVTNWDVTEYAGKTAVGSVRDSFTLGKEDGLLVFRADSKNPPVQGHTYSLTATLTLDNGRSLTLNNLKLPVKRTDVKLKLSKTSLSLNQKIGDTAVVDVTCLTRGYDFTNPVSALIPPNSKDGQSIDLSQPGTQEPLTVSWSDGKLTVTANSTAEAGKTYKIALRATENDPAVTLSVKILDTAVTASMKASGTIDVVRDGTAITVTPSYKNYAGLADIAPQLTIESGNGKTYKEVDAGLFSIVHNENGTFTITKVPGAEVDTALKYRAKLTFKGGANPTYVNLAVKSGTAKVAVSGTPVLYKADRFSRGTFRLTTADKALNPIVKAEIKDAKYQGIFEVYSYGSGEFAIGFKGNKVPDGKLPTSVVLNVYVDGNPAKGVASVALKLQVR